MIKPSSAVRFIHWFIVSIICHSISLPFLTTPTGTRLMGGKDAASPRYVFTKLENITRCIFHPHDDPLLNYLDDDGAYVEKKTIIFFMLSLPFLDFK